MLAVQILADTFGRFDGLRFLLDSGSVGPSAPNYLFDGLIWQKARWRLDRLWHNSGVETFFPRAAPIPREATKFRLCCRAHLWCAVGCLWPADRHRGRAIGQRATE